MSRRSVSFRRLLRTNARRFTGRLVEVMGSHLQVVLTATSGLLPIHMQTT